MDKEQQKVLESFGITWKELGSSLQRQPKLTYYKPDGEPLPNLPADPIFLKRYLDRGFSLTPPCEWPPKVKRETLEAIAPKNGTFVCAECGKSFEYKVALAGHQRTHKK